MILMAIFWVVVVGLIVLAFVRMGRHGHLCCSPRTHDALDIAKERYAKGEINEKELEQIKKNLS